MNRVAIEIGTASFRTTRGYTFAAVLADEVAFWRSDESSANPDAEIMRALRPGLATIAGAVLLMAVEPVRQARRALQRLPPAFRQGRCASVLVWKAATLAMHPTLDKRIVDEAYEATPRRRGPSMGPNFVTDLADFVTREAIDAVTAWGRAELPPEPGIVYSAFCDPSGGVRDAMTLAIVHLSRGGTCVLDAALEVRPPFHPYEAIGRCVTPSAALPGRDDGVATNMPASGRSRVSQSKGSSSSRAPGRRAIFMATCCR